MPMVVNRYDHVKAMTDQYACSEEVTSAFVDFSSLKGNIINHENLTCVTRNKEQCTIIPMMHVLGGQKQSCESRKSIGNWM